MSVDDMHPDLEWLARNVSDWPEGAERIRLDRDGEVCFSGAKIDDEFDFYADDKALVKEIFRKSNTGGLTGLLYSHCRWLQARKDLGLIMSDEEMEMPAEEWNGYVDADDDTIKTTIGTLRSKYHVVIKGVQVDVYDVLHGFGVTNPADAHAIKKMLKAGQGGYKDANQDRQEAIDSIKRAMELEDEM